jgi:methionine biosynthesis protein MetW
MSLAAGGIREDLRLIADIVEPGARVLDVGCGDGALLAYLAAALGVDGRGIELSEAGVNAAVTRGLSVVQGNADQDLADYPDLAFDVAILSQTLQATRKPRRVLQNLVRIGRRAIVSFPNFGHWRIRLALLLGGRMPVNDLLPYAWYDTPNIHHCTIVDFAALCREVGIVVEEGLMLDATGRPWRFAAPGLLANVLAGQAIFVLRRADRKPSGAVCRAKGERDG